MSLNPVLYAEDEKDDVFFLERAFHEARVLNPLVIIPDGLKALEYLSGTGLYANRDEYPLPCLLLLDLNMPGKSGFEVLKWIRRQPAHCTLPVVMLTSSTQDADVHRAYMQGANGFLVKPSRPADLIQLVKALKDFWLLQN